MGSGGVGCGLGEPLRPSAPLGVAPLWEGLSQGAPGRAKGEAAPRGQRAALTG